MGDKITEQEKAAIAAFAGIVIRCPDGEAAHAHICWGNGDYENWISRQGLQVVPEREAIFGHLGNKPSGQRAKILAGSAGDLVSQIEQNLKAAA